MHARTRLESRLSGNLVLLLGAAIAAGGSPAVAAVPLNGLIGWWKGDGNALDASPIANHGAFGGAYVPGPSGGHQAFNLNGSYPAQKVVIPDHAAYDFRSYDGWTVSFCFNANGTNLRDKGFFLGQNNGSGFQPKWFVDYGYTVFSPTDTFVLHFNDFNGQRIFIESDAVLPPSIGWNHLAVVVNHLDWTTSFYLNGAPIGVRSISNYVLQTNAPLVFGHTEGNFEYDGLMNDVTLHNRTLSPEEVAGCVPSPSAALVIVCGMLTRLRRRRRDAM